MTTKAEMAKKYFTDGYNCAQAVVLAFADEMNIGRDEALKLASSFGGGFGRLREVCGAFSGASIVAGIKYGYSNPDATDEKADHYKLIQQMAAEFEKRNKSIICKDLTGMGRDGHIPEARSKEYYQKRPCADLVYDAAEILEKLINEKENK